MVNGFIVNTRSLSRRMSGVERYTSEVVKRLGPDVRKVFPRRTPNAALGHLWEQVVLPYQVKKGELLWSPANTGPLAVRHQVLTLHDTNVLEHPEWFQPAFVAWYGWALPRLVQSVRRVITVSEDSRQRVLELFHIPEERVVAIPAGVDLDYFQPASLKAIARVRRWYNLERDYLLFVGTIEPRKNLPRLIQAWQQVKMCFPGLDLVIAGSRASHFAPTSPFLPTEGLQLIGRVRENDLPALYSAAKIFVLPSLSEGFGLTALEAMACGTPVIVSKAGALPETVGQAGYLVDPKEPDSLAVAIHHLMSDEECWRGYRRRGLEHAQRFSWQKTADRIRQELEIARQEG